MTADYGQSRSLRLLEKAENVEGLSPVIETGAPQCNGKSQVVVEVACAAVNPSDVKAAIGMMPYAVWPRTPGRDFAGRIVDGPQHLIGTEVWGSSGDLGIRRDGSHATHLVLDDDCIARKPGNISLIEAGAAGVPFVTAWEGLKRAGLPKPGEAVVIMGANGKVGQAAVQMVTMLGARAIGVTRRAESYVGHANAEVEMIDSSATDVGAAIRERTDGIGAPLIYNTVGSPYMQAAADGLARRGRQILIGTIERVVPFDILQFYRGQHQYLGIDTLALDTRATVASLTELAPHFESGALRPFAVKPDGIHSLEQAAIAYAKVMRSDRERVVIVPQ